MQMTPHFTLAELTRSNTAQRLGLDNSLPPQYLGNLQALADMLERVRAALGGLPLVVTSAYRGRAVNAAVGGVATSDHCLAQAADVVCPAYGTPYAVARALVPQLNALGIGQIALEGVRGKQWLHLSTRVPAKVVDRVITITDAGTQAGIQHLA
jgi:zinc D-Ala-D-Ala carboxypeptidase